jgi:C-terminal processing protease CtpA/Prc
MPAHRCGALFVGDAILSVNGIDLRDAKHAEAVHILSSQVKYQEELCISTV